MGVRAEQVALAEHLRSAGATWSQVAAEFRSRWGLNSRQTLRVARGWSQQQVADEWCRRWPDDPKSYKNLSTWERWPEHGHAPSLVVLDRLARIYRCAVADLVADLGDYEFDKPGAVADDPTMDRRTLLAGLGSSLLAASTLDRRPAEHATADTLDYLGTQLASHWQADRRLGPCAIVGTATAQYAMAIEILDTSRGSLHRRALDLATAFAGFLGWLYQDSGDLTACGRWLDVALELAHRAGDPQLVAYALTSKAMVRVDAGDGATALDLTGAALSDGDRLAPKARVMAFQQAALGNALVGDRAAVDRLLDAIGQQLDAIATQHQPWGGDRLRQTSGQVVDVQRATCYGRLGLHDEAAGLWDSIGHQVPSQDRRDMGVYLARHATALVGAGAVDDATERAATAVEHHRQTGSARLASELALLRINAIPLALTPAGRDLTDVLASVN